MCHVRGARKADLPELNDRGRGTSMPDTVRSSQSVRCRNLFRRQPWLSRRCDVGCPRGNTKAGWSA